MKPGDQILVYPPSGIPVWAVVTADQHPDGRLAVAIDEHEMGGDEFPFGRRLTIERASDGGRYVPAADGRQIHETDTNSTGQ